MNEFEAHELLAWLSGIIVPILLVAWIATNRLLRRIVDMLENPQVHGFGTDGMHELHGEVIKLAEAQLRATRELIHYTKYLAKSSNGGHEPPPYVSDPENHG